MHLLSTVMLFGQFLLACKK